MKLSRAHVTLIGLAVLAFVITLGLAHTVLSEHSAPPDLAAAAATSFAGLEPAPAEPSLPGLTAVRPRPAEVVQIPGPFDDRFRLDGLRLDAGAVHGSATITSDVSDVLEFEVVAGFYDDHGRLLGTGRFVHHLDEGVGGAHGHAGPPVETQDFDIPVPAGLGDRAVAASVGVPVLVNE